jgi:hypothetical protein
VGLRFKSKKPDNITNRTSYVIESRIVAVRKATGFGPEQLANLVNESPNEYRLTLKSSAFNYIASTFVYRVTFI